MLEALSTLNWTVPAQPAGNTERTVPDAIRCLAQTTEAASRDAYHRVLSAVGNDHAGTYYPVVVDVIPFLGEILAGDNPAARARTLDVLIDLVGSFEPEPGYDIVETEAGPRQLSSLLRDAVARLTPAVAALAAVSDEEASLADQLAELFRS